MALCIFKQKISWLSYFSIIFLFSCFFLTYVTLLHIMKIKKSCCFSTAKKKKSKLTKKKLNNDSKKAKKSKAIFIFCIRLINLFARTIKKKKKKRNLNVFVLLLLLCRLYFLIQNEIISDTRVYFSLGMNRLILYK